MSVIKVFVFPLVITELFAASLLRFLPVFELWQNAAFVDSAESRQAVRRVYPLAERFWEALSRYSVAERSKQDEYA